MNMWCGADSRLDTNLGCCPRCGSDNTEMWDLDIHFSTGNFMASCKDCRLSLNSFEGSEIEAYIAWQSVCDQLEKRKARREPGSFHR